MAALPSMKVNERLRVGAPPAPSFDGWAPLMMGTSTIPTTTQYTPQVEHVCNAPSFYALMCVFK
jgi:hypothetical protein